MSDGTEPRTKARTVVETWYAVDGPVRCECGHLHWGWQDEKRYWAPQWGYCGECPCTLLRRAAAPSPAVSAAVPSTPEETPK